MIPLCYNRHRFSAAGHPALDLAISPLHTELPRRGASPGGAWARYLVRDGAALSSEVRPDDRAQTAAAPRPPERPMLGWTAPAASMCQAEVVCRSQGRRPSM